MAKLYFRYGAMNSGKSTALMQVAHNYRERGMRAVILKPTVDTKGGEQIVSRLGVAFQVDLLLKKDQNAYHEIISHFYDIDCVLVDEAQFLTRDQVDQLFEYAVKEKVPVICYGLRTDFRREGFEGSKRLLLLAHSIEELKTICRCGKKAVFNGRKINGRFVFEGEQVAIDGENKVEYESLCAQCYYTYQEQE
ncbi:MAG: thymidine kinase [delta proteobacterium ML8_F1]|nr:MAG: thymidine kinase [delta proteobacterium ML8_F1]